MAGILNRHFDAFRTAAASTIRTPLRVADMLTAVRHKTTQVTLRGNPGGKDGRHLLGELLSLASSTGKADT